MTRVRAFFQEPRLAPFVGLAQAPSMLAPAKSHAFRRRHINESCKQGAIYNETAAGGIVGALHFRCRSRLGDFGTSSLAWCGMPCITVASSCFCVCTFLPQTSVLIPPALDGGTAAAVRRFDHVLG